MIISSGKQTVPFMDLKAQNRPIEGELRRVMAEVMADCAFIGGKYVAQFEEDFSRFTGTAHVVGVANGTDALTLTLKAFSLEPGFEAIVPASSFIATAEAVTQAGGRVRFCDVEPDTHLISLDQAEGLVSASTRVIIPVHLYGQQVDMTQVRAFADRHHLKVIEDAAQAHGARFQGIPVGQLSNAAAYSFYPAKNLGACGDAGAVTTAERSLAVKIRKLGNHGSLEREGHEFEGYNSRLDGLQAAVLSVKLGHLPAWDRQRREAAEYYHHCLASLPVILPRPSEPGRHVYHLYVIRVRRRNDVLLQLQAAGIAVRVHYPVSLPFLPAYSHLGHRPEQFPVAVAHSQEVLSLPFFPEITREQQDTVAAALKGVLATLDVAAPEEIPGSGHPPD